MQISIDHPRNQIGQFLADLASVFRSEPHDGLCIACRLVPNVEPSAMCEECFINNPTP